MVKTLYFLVMLFLANVAWFSDKWLGILGHVQSLWQRFIQLIPLFLFAIAIGFIAERYVMGQVSQQGWEFYSVTFALFLVFSFPGFIYRVVRK